MASFLYYFYEVNVMNCILSWINGSTITFINFLSKLEWVQLLIRLAVLVH